jgi:hypothetical protein
MLGLAANREIGDFWYSRPVCAIGDFKFGGEDKERSIRA